MAAEMTPKQEAFLRRLLAERPSVLQNGATADDFIAALRAREITPAQASNLIDQVMALPVEVKAAPKAACVRTNQYGGKCANCGAYVQAGQGRIEKSPAGKWLTLHLDGACAEKEVEEEFEGVGSGVYEMDGRIYKVVKAVHGAGRYYAKVLDTSSGRPHWDRTPGYRKLRPEMALSAEKAAEFGRLYGECVRCARTLTDERSIKVGYGETCANHMGWPWGEV